MKEPNRVRKNEIKSINSITLNEEQKEAKRLIIENQIVIVTGAAGSGKSLVCANTALDFLKKKQIECIYNTRAAIEVGKSLGYLPGGLGEKFDPYMEALIENLNKCCTDKTEVPKLIQDEKIKAMPVQFIRGKTIDDILIVEEAQNLTKGEMLAILTRLGKTGKIVINGDNNQTDIKTSDGQINGLTYAIELSKKIEEIKWIKLKENHRSDLVGKILDYEYKKIL
jgi:predicted ribonuclease YlaK